MQTPMNDKYEKIKLQSRLRQQKFYMKNKVILLQKRKDQRRLNKDVVMEEVIIAPREIINLEFITNKINVVSENEITRKTHVQRMKTFFELTGTDNLEENLIDHVKIIDCIELATYGTKTKKTYKVNSKKNIMESLLFVLDKCGVLLDVTIRTKYQDYYEKLKIISSDQLQMSKTNKMDSVLHFEDYRNRIKDYYGTKGKQFLLVKMYESCSCRDDYGRMKIVTTMEETTLDKNSNFLVLNELDCNICIQDYKTSKNKEAIFVSLPIETRLLIENYIKKNNLTNVLFPSKSLSQYIKNMNKRVNIDGSINYIRHSVVSSILNDLDISPQERLDLSKRMFHSPITSLDYIRMIEDSDHKTSLLL